MKTVVEMDVGVARSPAIDQLVFDFDAVFAEPMAFELTGQRLFLNIAVQQDRFAIALEALTELRPRSTWVAIPSYNPALVGLVGLNGKVAPVFCLPELLGYSVDETLLRWLTLCGVDQAIGLAFESVLGTLQVEEAAIHPMQQGHAASDLLSGIVQTPQHASKLIDVPKLLARLEQAAKPQQGVSW